MLNNKQINKSVEFILEKLNISKDKEERFSSLLKSRFKNRDLCFFRISKRFDNEIITDIMDQLGISNKDFADIEIGFFDNDVQLWSSK